MPVNIVAPYILIAVLGQSRRIVHLSSGSHLSGDPSLAGVGWRGRLEL
jgi:hypothetical protein